jgi:DtxR family Mn-dependent transcriptional regulator
MTEALSVSSSLEDYLEAIYHLERTNRVARSKDISGRLGVSTASVTGAMRALAQRKLVNYAPYEVVTLTKVGRKLAAGVAGRHQALKEFFVSVLGVDEKVAGENACRIEHAISETLLERLIRFVEFIRVCPRAGARWVERFGYFCQHPECGDSREECSRCLAETRPAMNAARKRGAE